MTGFGDAAIIRHADGSLTVLHADDVIGFSLELLAERPDGLLVDADGCVQLAGKPGHQYRPTRFVASSHGGPPTILVCERVREADGER